MHVYIKNMHVRENISDKTLESQRKTCATFQKSQLLTFPDIAIHKGLWKKAAYYTAGGWAKPWKTSHSQLMCRKEELGNSCSSVGSFQLVLLETDVL